jgi:hypothetical protein
MYDLVTAVVAALAYAWVMMAAAIWAARLARAVAEENPPRWEFTVV